MSLTKVVDPLVKSVNFQYSKKLLEFNGFEVIETCGTLHKTKGFDKYNYLLEINSIFSNNPKFDLVDRTNMALGPIVYAAERPWKIPKIELDLETALKKRVADICGMNQKINLMWSGGIDSTAIVVAFLQYAPDLSHCRIVYSPWSTYEHPDFFNLLKSIQQIELVDTSGDFYLNCSLDGIFVSGNTGDEMHASIDQSFFDQYGYDFLFSNWKDFFYNKCPDSNFIEFCEQHFAASGKEINTVLDARWWFYASTKLTSMLNTYNLAFFTAGNNDFDPCRLVGFFDCDVYEQFIYFNVDKIIQSNSYACWKQFLKDYCCRYDGFEDWRVNKSKFGSNQIQIYMYKKQILNDSRNLMLLDNGKRVATTSLPLFSAGEWNQIKQSYQHVFRSPSTI